MKMTLMLLLTFGVVGMAQSHSTALNSSVEIIETQNGSRLRVVGDVAESWFNLMQVNAETPLFESGVLVKTIENTQCVKKQNNNYYCTFGSTK